MHLNMFKTSFGAAKMAFKCLFIHVLDIFLDKNLNFCFVQNDLEYITAHHFINAKNFKYIVGNL